jgi:hypothetical protein
MGKGIRMQFTICEYSSDTVASVGRRKDMQNDAAIVRHLAKYLQVAMQDIERLWRQRSSLEKPSADETLRRAHETLGTLWELLEGYEPV